MGRVHITDAYKELCFSVRFERCTLHHFKGIDMVIGETGTFSSPRKVPQPDSVTFFVFLTCFVGGGALLWAY